MRANGFGRRITDSAGRDLVVVPRPPEESLAPDHGAYAGLKEQIRVVLMSRMFNLRFRRRSISCDAACYRRGCEGVKKPGRW